MLFNILVQNQKDLEEAILTRKPIRFNGAVSRLVRGGYTGVKITILPDIAICPLRLPGQVLVFNVTLDGLLGTGSQTISNFAVYPNPTSNVVNVSANKALVSGVNFADLNGRVVKTAKFDGVAEAQVNISDLASGVYMMSISSDKGTTVKKIVKN